MEKLVINVPDSKSALVKELLTELGVTIQQSSSSKDDYQTELQNVSVWTEDDLKIFEQSRKALTA